MADHIYPERPPMIVTYETEYQWFGDDGDQSAEGDYEGAIRRVFACVPDQWDVEDGKTSVDLALDVLNDLPCYLQPDCSPGIPSWFSGTDENSTDRHFRTGAWDEHSAHLYGFTDDERARIGQLYASR
jgi:hypothetical protein